ncbi:peptide/nickel transport system substrate-binding protein [Rubrimonas cliftonensis]|uniref:Peptide/nickel transport system substrate-binding protein n=1 Tax=Rubrimonas cliftonensis TaxID=89524 RepID=A0A1H4GDT7_9RHOB|nr:peptide/nickel transport system substrate-binding protein [Rubrimonas cliftonensis]
MRHLLTGPIALAIFATANVATPAAAQTRTAVSVAAPWHVNTYEPSQDGYIFQRMQIGETLVEVCDEGALCPGLSTGWTASADGLEWRFDVRQGVLFHDGGRMDAETVAASLRRAAGRPGILSSVPVTAITTDRSAVVIRLETPYAALPAALANYGAMILAPTSFDAEGAAVAFVGTGPFRMVGMEPPLSLAAERFDGYWGEAASVSEVRYLSSHRPETRALMIESGDADLAVNLDKAGFHRLDELDLSTVHAVAIPRTIMVKMNLARPQLAEADARRALSLAIDREGVAAGILDFPESAANQLFPPVLTGWHDAAEPPAAYDPEQARALLADLGWAPGPDGVLARGGERFSLTLRTYPNRPELPLIAAALQDQWRDIGVEVKVSVGNSSEVPGGHQDGTLDLALAARNYGLTPDPVVNAFDDFKAGGGDWGAMNWDAPAVHEALRVALAEADPEARTEAIRAVTKALQAELPVIPVAWSVLTAASAAKLEGVSMDPLERSYGLSQVRWSD